MKALTLTQPWADLVASGHKRWETRSWSTNYRGLVAIHAAKGFPKYAQVFASEEMAFGRLAPRIARGAIIAVARIVDVRPTEEVALEIEGLERRLGDYAWGRFAWQLADVVRLDEPIGCKGMLGLWAVPDAIARRLP